MSREAMQMALEALERYGGVDQRACDAEEALRQALETEQEPVAWMHNFIEHNVITHIPADIGRHPERWTPLYTAPPKREWVGLTPYEIQEIHSGNQHWGNFACAVEAKLKEKNGG